MPLSRNLNTYADVEAVLQACRKSGATRCSYSLETRSLAVNWRARAYMYRTLLREQASAKLRIPGYSPTTNWDDMILELAPGSREVIIKLGVVTTGQLVIDGKPVEIGPVTMPEPVAEKVIDQLLEAVDPLEREAAALIERYGAEE